MNIKDGLAYATHESHDYWSTPSDYDKYELAKLQGFPYWEVMNDRTYFAFQRAWPLTENQFHILRYNHFIGL